MNTLKYTGSFKKDLKKYQNYPEKIEALEIILKCLQEAGTVPAKYKPHRLKGQYPDCMECHIGSDYLLIWMDPENNVIKLVRLGSHSELFG